jgi:hypothetical protein
MVDLIPPEGASEKQIDEFLASVRADARKHVRELLAGGAPESEIAEYIASLEPLAPDALPTEGEDR